MDNPIKKFESWWREALADSPLQQKSAVCVCTVDEHGFPAARFVDLKSVSEQGFVFCTYLNSAKGKHLAKNPKIAMTIWWDHVGYQIRVVGIAKLITDVEADNYWKTRNKSAQLTTTAFEQSAALISESDLSTLLQEITEQYADKKVPRPDSWGGYCIKPVSIEFLTFRESRLHLRELFEYSDNCWKQQLLQP